MICNKVAAPSVRFAKKAGRASVCTRATLLKTDTLAAAARRSLLFGGMISAASIISAPAFALIPEEEDADLLGKAKANRSKKLAANKEATREFLKDEGLKDVRLDQELVVVEKGVLKLAQFGAQLEVGDVRSAAYTLNEAWVPQFQVACYNIGGSGSDTVVSKLASLKSATANGDVAASKRAYVALVAELQFWSSAVPGGMQLQGLN